MKHQNFNNDQRDRELNAALANYTSVEPRAGLEDRVLAHLRAEKEHAPVRSRMYWLALAALATMIVVVASLTWTSPKSAQSGPSQPMAAATQSDKQGMRIANYKEGGPIPPRQAGSRGRLKFHAFHSATVVALAPKLDQFPSPQPLSEQETILFRYITNYPEHAALIAQARTDELRRDRIEEMSFPADDEDSRQQNK
jgi:hypothetical protein